MLHHPHAAALAFDPTLPFKEPTLSSVPPHTPSLLVSRNITVNGHRTSVRLEPDMWNGLREICHRERQTLHEVCTSVALRKPENASLTAAIRVFVMTYFRLAATEEGHAKIGHGPGGPFAPRTYAPAIPLPHTVNTVKIPDHVSNDVGLPT